MGVVSETVTQAFAWLRGELWISAAIATLLVGPGAVLCWFAYHVTAIRLAPGALRPARFRRRPGAIDRVEQRLTNLCTALSILTDSTESGLRATIAGLERLSGVTPATAGPTFDVAVASVRSSDSSSAPVFAPLTEGRTPRDIAIAEGV